MKSMVCPKCGRTTLNKTCDYCGHVFTDTKTQFTNSIRSLIKELLTPYAIVAIVLWSIYCLSCLSQIKVIGIFPYLGVCLFGYCFVIGIADAIYFSKSKKKNAIKVNSEPYHYTYMGYMDLPEELRNAEEKYYDGTQKIQTMWSVLYNLNGFHGEQADTFETVCYENLADLQNKLLINKKYGCDSRMPTSVPAYVRLAMLYEKQGKYQEAINICVDAIKNGAVLDGNQGQMQGRLARLIKKSGLSVNNDILSLITYTNTK